MSWDNNAGGNVAVKAWNTEATDTYTGGDARMTKVAGDEFGDAGNVGGDACRKCGEQGHFARECPQGGGSACFNCGEEGHMKTECTNPRMERPFTGSCRYCKAEGHRATECPEKPAEVCKNCLAPGHKAVDCEDVRARDLSGIEVKTPEAAWNALIDADKSRDLDDVREAIKVYSKAIPDTTYLQLETAFRHLKCNTHLIAQEKELNETYTNMDLQGKLGCKYSVGLFFGPKCPRKVFQDSWPASPEENVERLRDAGVAVDKMIPKCGNCEQLGHTTKFCTEEKLEREAGAIVMCVNCEATGHRARDCTEARKDHFACRNCKKSGHVATECTEPRSAEGVECKNCNEVGHFAKDCPTRVPRLCRNCLQEGHNSKECEEPRNPATIVCRNCDETGHMSKECPKPRDYSRVKCTNCEQLGHTKVRCKQPIKEDDGGFDTPGGSGGGFDTVGRGNAGGSNGFDGGFEAPAQSSSTPADDGW